MGGKPVASMIGRDDATRGLQEHCHEGPIVLVTGEAGIGKTVLVEQYLSRPTERQDLILAGGCVELLGEPLPYSPLAEALREEHRKLSMNGQDHLARQVRDNLDILLGIATDNATRGRAELFERVLQVLIALTPTSGRLVLVCEDLHWADQATLDILIFLARNLPPDALMLLTCRDERLASDPRLQSFINALQHSGKVHRIELSRLDRHEIAVLLAQREPGKLPPEVVERVYRRSEGNPFIALELLQADRMGEKLTNTLEGLLLARTTELNQDAQDVIRLAAVVGRRVDYSTLSAVGFPEPALLSGLHDAVTHGVLLFNRQTDVYAFRHAITQEAVLGTLMPAERRALHAVVAKAIEQQTTSRNSPDRAAEVATHWYAADDPRHALPAGLKAARLAAKVFAYSEAWRHYQHVLAIYDRYLQLNQDGRANIDDGADINEGQLFAEAAEAARWAGSLSQAVKLLTDAQQVTSDPLSRADLTERLGHYWWEMGRPTEAAEEYDAAYVSVRNMPPTQQTARIAASRAHLELLLGHHSAAVPLARHAIELATISDASLQLGRASITLGICLTFLGSFDDGARLVREGHTLVSRHGDLDDRRRADSNLAYTLVMSGDTIGGCQAAVEGLKLLTRYGLEGQAGAALTGNTIVLLRLAGRWDEAIALSDDVLARGIPDTQARYVRLARAGLDIGRGRLADARIHLALAYPPAADMEHHLLLKAELHAAEAELALEEGDIIKARQMASVASAALRLGEHDRFIIQVTRLQLQIEAEVACFPTPKAKAGTRIHPKPEVLDSLSAVVSKIEHTCMSREIAAHVKTAHAECARAQQNNDPARWRMATQTWDALGRPREVAYHSWRTAEAILANGGSGKDGALPLRRGHRIASELGAELLVDRIEDLARRSRVSLKEQTATRSSNAAFGLTHRELDVLQELTKGSSNKEIAKRLFLSERTVGVHVSHVIAKLGVGRRGEAAAVANKYEIISNRKGASNA